MSAIDDILGQLPIDQLADQLGADPQQVQAASAAVLPRCSGPAGQRGRRRSLFDP